MICVPGDATMPGKGKSIFVYLSKSWFRNTIVILKVDVTWEWHRVWIEDL